MKMYCITDNIETAVGLRLTGIESTIVSEREEIENEIDNILKDNEVGILIYTPVIYKISKEKLDNIRNNRKMPLLVCLVDEVKGEQGEYKR